jgi:hypothetical protein
MSMPVRRFAAALRLRHDLHERGRILRPWIEAVRQHETGVAAFRQVARDQQAFAVERQAQEGAARRDHEGRVVGLPGGARHGLEGGLGHVAQRLARAYFALAVKLYMVL